MGISEDEFFFTAENEAALARCRHVTVNMERNQVWADANDEETAAATGLRYVAYQPAMMTDPERRRYSITSSEPLAIVAAIRIAAARDATEVREAA